MDKLAATTCFATKPDATGRDRMLGDGDGLFLRIRPHGTRTWVIEYALERVRRKVTIGVLDEAGAVGESIASWLENGCLSLTQARAIAGQWKADRRAGLDPIGEWEARLEAIQWRTLGDLVPCTADRISVAALRMLIRTGQRERGVIDAEWTEFDLSAGMWRIPAVRTESGRAHPVHLAPQAVTILDSRIAAHSDIRAPGPRFRTIHRPQDRQTRAAGGADALQPQ